jgi:hypothetical protein
MKTKDCTSDSESSITENAGKQKNREFDALIAGVSWTNLFILGGALMGNWYISMALHLFFAVTTVAIALYRWERK